MGVKVVNSIEVKDYNKIKKKFALRPAGTCESIINNSFIWRDYYNAKYIEDENGLIFLFDIGDGIFTSSPLCKKEDIAEYVKLTKRYFKEELKTELRMYVTDKETVYELVKAGRKISEDENVIKVEIDGDIYEITEERDYFDYIYDAEKLRTFSGKKYHRKKNHLNAFLKEYEGRYTTREMDFDDKEEICAFLDEWHSARDIEDEYNRDEYELKGIKRFLEECRGIAEDTNIKMFGVYVDGKLEAFTMGTYLKDRKEAFVHVEKANPNMRGLYIFINREFQINAFPNAELVNREDDMGLSGLRQAKMGLNPIDFEKKYTVISK